VQNDDAAIDALCQAALQAATRAYAPYSRFQVGAALLCEDGRVVEGCNVENASYGLCICAERTAIAAAVAQGRRRFPAIAVATSSSPPSSPCGMCRQVLVEFLAPGQDTDVVLVNAAGERITTTARALLPGGFDKSQLASGQSSPDRGPP
jgi:cytidine deaminase